MLWFVLAILFGIAGLVVFFIGKIKTYGGDEYNIRPYALIGILPAILFLFLSTLRVVSPGHVGIPVTFGKAGTAKGAGIQFVAPWTGMRNLSVQVENYTMSSATGEGVKQGDDSVPVNTKDQVEVNVDSTALFKLTRPQARNVYVNIGTDFVQQVVRPTIRSAIRDAAVKYEAIDLATNDRAAFQAAARAQIKTTLKTYGIDIVDLQIRDMHLPVDLQNSITAKAAAQQDAAKQAFVLKTVSQQAQQRVVEAQGIARSQEIIRQTLTPQYLSHEYITAMEKLAGSPNTTFLFVPSDPSQLPQFQLPLPSNAK